MKGSHHVGINIVHVSNVGVSEVAVYRVMGYIVMGCLICILTSSRERVDGLVRGYVVVLICLHCIASL